jgi:hypothetical protein
LFIVLLSTTAKAMMISSPQNNATYTSSDVFFSIATDSTTQITMQESGKGKVILCASCQQSDSIQSFEKGNHIVTISDQKNSQILKFQVTQAILTPKLILTQNSGFVYNKKIIARLVVTEQTGQIIKPESASLKVSGEQLDEPIIQQMSLNNGYLETNIVLPAEGTYQFDATTTVQGATLKTSQVYAYHTQPSLIMYSAAFLINQNKDFAVIRHITFIFNEGMDATNIVVNQKSPKNGAILRVYPQTANTDSIQWIIPIIKQGETVSVAYDFQTNQKNSVSLESAEILIGEQKTTANPVTLSIPQYQDSSMNAYKAVLDSKIVGNTITFTTSAYADAHTSATKISISDENQQKDYANTKVDIYELKNTITFDREQSGRNEVLPTATATLTDNGIRVTSTSQPTQVYIPGLTAKTQNIPKTQKIYTNPATVMVFIMFFLIGTFITLAKIVPKRPR